MKLLNAVYGCISLVSFQFSGVLSSDLRNSSELEDQQNYQVGAPVKTTSGLIIGHPASNRSQVSEYLGIPFALPPVGQLRFAAPRSFHSEQTFNAISYSPDCPANLLPPEAIIPILPLIAEPQGLRLLEELGQSGNNQSEDCLTLNIWTKPQTGERKKAVLFWIYGGGFSTGSTNNPTYNGQYFANDDDVVVVSANYRVNVFGFPGLPGRNSPPQNPGLLDQRLAILWVEKNIHMFGGDKDRITIFGQSAGGGSVDYYSYAWTKVPVVNGFIAESGTVTSFSLNPPAQNNLAAWFNASVALGCGGPAVGIESSVACVRTKPFQAVLAATRVSNPLAAVLGNFGPTADGRVIFSDYTRRGEQGEFIRRPFFTGSNFNEAGLFKILAAAGNFSLTETQWALFNLQVFQCPAATAARNRFRADVPVWRYLYFGDFPNLVLTNDPPSGAWHGSEIPIVWKTSVDASGLPNTPAENSISTFLNKAWAAFAKDPWDAFDRAPYYFPEYDPGGASYPYRQEHESSPERSLLLLALHNRTRPSAVYPHRFDALCPLIEYLSDTMPGFLNTVVLNPTGFGLRDFAALAARAPPHLVAGNATRLLETYILQIRNPNLVVVDDDQQEPTGPWPHKEHKVPQPVPVGGKVSAWDTWDSSEVVLQPA